MGVAMGQSDEPTCEPAFEDEFPEQDPTEKNVENVQGVLFWETESTGVPIANTDKLLIVSGPAAGQVSEADEVDSMEPGKAPPIQSRDEVLDGEGPLFLVHRGGQHHGQLPHLLAQLHTNFGKQISLGAVIKIPRQSAEAGRKFFASCGPASIRIADPVCYELDEGAFQLRRDAISERAKQRAPYLAKGNRKDLLASVLDAQRGVGANLLLTPGRALNPDDSDKALEELFEEGERALSTLNRGERLALNITISNRWLTNAPLLEKLLNELLDHDEHDVWYMRVQWRAQKAYSQPKDADLLRGYKKLSQLALDEDRRLLLPQTGLTGWLMTAFGAKGFGSGSSGADQAFVEPSYGRPKQATRKERYFEKQLIHTVERNVHEVLANSADYQNCDCPYCPVLFSSPGWSHEFSGLHHLYRVGQLMAEVEQDSARGGRYSAMRRVINRAIRYARGKELADINAPQHLAVWDQLL